MNDVDLERYCERAVNGGATQAKQIQPSTIVTAPWVRLKCQFGCPRYDKSYCCPPDTPEPEQTREIIDSYNRSILFHRESPKVEGRPRPYREYLDRLIELEGEMFKDGYYKALVLLCGPCHLCKECGKIKGDPCAFGHRARPAMEACGIDVYQTARNNGFFIEPLHDRDQTRNLYCLMLVD